MNNDMFLTPSEERALRRLARGKRIKEDVASNLCSAGFAECKFLAKSNKMFVYRPTPDGRRYIARRNEFKREIRWTRLLAVAAVVISLFAFLLEFEDHGYLDRLSTWVADAAQALQSKIESP